LALDVVSYNAAISACNQCMLWDKALGLLHEIVHQLLSLDVVIYTSAGCPRC
jgi:pentatricopeptide repeat protein